RLVWTGYVAAGCALLRLPVHVYYGLGGTSGLAGVDPVIDAAPHWLSPVASGLLWRIAHLGTALLLAAVAVLAVALVRPWGRRLPTSALVVPAFAVTVVSLAYAGAMAVAAGLRLAPGGVPDVAARMTDVGMLGGRAVGDLAAVVGSTAPERAALHYAQWLGEPLSSFPLTGPVALAPWALLLGLLLAVAVSVRLGGATARRIWLVAVALGVLRLLV
ncbi:MAG TPA: hypothetical protein VFT95_02345, partial [Micromonosporaceae bacterium]|nr:hypothetical protein [Micromonosporaceae bacterium]